MGFKIGSFNMRNIGFSALADSNERDIEKIAEIIKKEQFDVVALQEVQSEGKAFYLPDFAKRTILMELGPDWDFRWGQASYKEELAFIWNKKRMRLPTVTLKDGTEREFEPRLCEVKEAGKMIRRPYYARFTPQGTFASNLAEFRLLCVHTYYGSESKADEALRLQELDLLLKEIYPQIYHDQFQSSVPSYTIVLGDYNAELYRPWHETLQRSKKALYMQETVCATNWDNLIINTYQDQLTTLKKPEEDDDDDGKSNRYSHNYDHFSYADDERFKELKMSCRRIDAVRKYTNDSPSEYLKKVSDHLPIMLSIEFN